MVTTNGQIIKIDTKDGFIDIRQAFLLGEGKVVFQFRNYDKNRPEGSRITKSIDFYMTIEEFLYFCEICKTGMIYQLMQNSIVEAQQSGRKYPAPAYMRLGGTTKKDGQVISRQFRIEGGGNNPVFLKALQGPGKKTETGMISPCYKDNEAEVKIVVKVDDEMLKKIGLMGQKAVDVFFLWSAQGHAYLEEKCYSLGYTAPDTQKQNPAAYNQPYGQYGQPYEQQVQQIQPAPGNVYHGDFSQYASAMEAGF